MAKTPNMRAWVDQPRDDDGKFSETSGGGGGAGAEGGGKKRDEGSRRREDRMRQAESVARARIDIEDRDKDAAVAEASKRTQRELDEEDAAIEAGDVRLPEAPKMRAHQDLLDETADDLERVHADLDARSREVAAAVGEYRRSVNEAAEEMARGDDLSIEDEAGRDAWNHAYEERTRAAEDIAGGDDLAEIAPIGAASAAASTRSAAAGDDARSWPEASDHEAYRPDVFVRDDLPEITDVSRGVPEERWARAKESAARALTQIEGYHDAQVDALERLRSREKELSKSARSAEKEFNAMDHKDMVSSDLRAEYDADVARDEWAEGSDRWKRASGAAERILESMSPQYRGISYLNDVSALKDSIKATARLAKEASRLAGRTPSLRAPVKPTRKKG